MAEEYNDGQVVRVMADIRLPNGVELNDRELQELSKDVSDYTHLVASKHKPDPGENRSAAHVHVSTAERRCNACHYHSADEVY